MKWGKLGKVLGVGALFILLGIIIGDLTLLFISSILGYLAMAIVGKMRYQLTDKELYSIAIVFIIIIWSLTLGTVTLFADYQIPDLLTLIIQIIFGIIGSLVFTFVGIRVAGLLTPTPNPNT